MILDFNTGNISPLANHLHIVIFAIPLHIKVGCEWVKINWKIVLVVSQGVGCKSKKLKKSQEECHKDFAEMEEGLQFKQSFLIACNQQLSRGTATASSSHHKLEIKIAIWWN